MCIILREVSIGVYRLRIGFFAFPFGAAVLSMFAKRTHAIAEKLRVGGGVGVVAEVCVAVIVKLNVNFNIGS